MTLDRFFEAITIAPDARVYATALVPLIVLALTYAFVKLSEHEERS